MSTHTGFTGTRKGMTREQANALVSAVHRLSGFLRHGDCIGSDATAHSIAIGVGLKVILHPPENPRLRAWCYGAFEVRPARSYIQRDIDIVNGSGLLLATPELMEETLRSGTWTTIRYARRRGIPIHIILPDGSVKEEQGA